MTPHQNFILSTQFLCIPKNFFCIFYKRMFICRTARIAISFKNNSFAIKSTQSWKFLQPKNSSYTVAKQSLRMSFRIPFDNFAAFFRRETLNSRSESKKVAPSFYMNQPINFAISSKPLLKSITLTIRHFLVKSSCWDVVDKKKKTFTGATTKLSWKKKKIATEKRLWVLWYFGSLASEQVPKRRYWHI